MDGQIIDATVVPAPKQRKTEDQKAAIKQDKSMGTLEGEAHQGSRERP